MMDLSVSGLDEMIARLEALSARVDAGMETYLHTHADDIWQQFVGCTPEDTGETAGAWAVDDMRGPLEVAVVNAHHTDRGFLVASALLTGTGERGAGATPALGYLGGFAATPGMFPALELQDVWNEAATTTLATPELVRALHA